MALLHILKLAFIDKKTFRFLLTGVLWPTRLIDLGRSNRTIFHNNLDTVSTRVSSFLVEASVALDQLSSPTPVNFPASLEISGGSRSMGVSNFQASLEVMEVNFPDNAILNSTRSEVVKAFKRSNKHLLISISGQGYPTNNIANGILVGPGGPTGIIGRPYGNRYGGGFPGGFGQHAFEGQHNALGSPFGGGFSGSPYGSGFGGPQFGIGALNPQFQGGFPGQLFDPNTKNLQVNKIEKSAE